MGCLGKYKTYKEYALARDIKKNIKDAKVSSRKEYRKWKKEDRENRRKILWAEALETGFIFGKSIKEVIYNRYSNSAKRRGISFDITLTEFCSFWQKPCAYCGSEIQTIGIDRMDSDIGYVLGNLAPCCTKCNLTKRKMSDFEYIEHCKKVANFTQSNYKQ